MNKQAYLEAAYNSGLDDELEKISALPGLSKVWVPGKVKNIANLSKGKVSTEEQARLAKAINHALENPGPNSGAKVISGIFHKK